LKELSVMANQWFRMYHEFATDPKVQMMSEPDQRRLIMILCLRCNGDVTLHDDEVAFQLRIKSEEWGVTKATFIEKGFIDSSNKVLNWDKRQFVSDSSTERVAKHRAGKKQQCNVTVTPPDTDTDTDTDTEVKEHTDPVGSAPAPEEKKRVSKKEYSDEFNNAFSIYPKRKGDNPKEKAFRAWKARLKEGVTANEMVSGVKRYLAFCQAEGNIGTQYIKQAATFFGPDKAFLESWEVIQKSPSSTPHRNPGFGKQPATRPIYTYPGGDADAIDSTATEVFDAQARL